jgi:hypothetical protein
MPYGTEDSAAILQDAMHYARLSVFGMIVCDNHNLRVQVIEVNRSRLLLRSVACQWENL